MLTYISIKENKKISKEIKELYESSFPEDEQVPFMILKHNAKKTNADLYAIYDKDCFIGMLSTVYYKDIVFLWYLAIKEEYRGKGYGTKVLKDCQNRYNNKRIILNVEEVEESYSDYEERFRRRQFYIRNKFISCGFKTDEYHVIYEMLYYGGNVTYDEYKALIISHSGKAVFNKIYKLVE